ncbi:MAG: SUMF1/EgtB/PvdO family nonheme iron enzyme [Akkermansiaceae bacterium]|nr:SUMF1/EgtB/PvdO family nonheme iron enzyme [Akkermansiaceae bacterium]
MPTKIRSSPTIPDHEVLRKIGGGAYGEVWMARGVTGALRAVKVVWREDFEDERSFEREFEGILKFEPISRDHPGFVNILHVGRSPDSGSFYYYVMELGDDLTCGQDINPVEYEPRTLRADSQQGIGVQWDTNECIDVGLRLSEALGNLHERGLAHRDVKPSNIIFVNGRAKLADIGLVAARGQRTFVGTEGFVPPEGPGTTQADIYGLGKVLYEIATGKDRLSFPELPDSMPSGPDGKRWLGLNKIICDVCDPRISKRKLSTAVDLADSLRRLQQGKRRRNHYPVWITTAFLFAFTGFVIWMILKDSSLFKFTSPQSQIKELPKKGVLRVVSAPEDAEVNDASGHFIGTTPTENIEVTAGDSYYYTVTKSGYRSLVLQGEVPATVATEPLALFAMLENFSPPQIGVTWEDHFGIRYDPLGETHQSLSFVAKENWQKFKRAKKDLNSTAEFLNITPNHKKTEIVLAPTSEVIAFCKWFEEGAKKDGFLTDDHEILPVFDEEFNHSDLSERARNDHLKPFRLLARQVPYGEISIKTDPPGADVYISAASDPSRRVLVGTADDTLLIPKVRPSSWQLYLVCEGYQAQTVDIKVGEGEKVIQAVTLKKSLGVVFEKPWKNGIGMSFVPMGPDLMASIWETRVQDYELFAKESGRGLISPDFPQAADHPAVNISREDAKAFCTWLTVREQKAERIAQTHMYRLPTDLEWSEMAGIVEKADMSPSWRDAQKESIFLWGNTWPPETAVGNFSDVATAAAPGYDVERTIPEYKDNFAYTAPVGSFRENSNGLFDLSGNIQEWVEDPYSTIGKNPLGVLRGGGWNTYQQENLKIGSRNPQPPTFRDVIYGFRVVLVKLPSKPE